MLQLASTGGWKWLEGACYAAGTAMSLFFVAQLALGEVQRREDIAAFASVQPLSSNATGARVDFANPGAPDMSLWSEGRIADYRAARAAASGSILGILQLPSVDLAVPVYASDSELNMDRGAGVIDGMAYPHEPGNIGIAGHRDGYFRSLKDVQVGDPLLLQTLEGPKRFTVSRIQIVEIADTHVLEDTDEQTLTLVTCYPFYYFGHAPQRFIVSASLDKHGGNHQ